MAKSAKLSIGSISLPKPKAVGIKPTAISKVKNPALPTANKLPKANKGLVRFLGAKKYGASSIARSAAKAQSLQMDVKGG